MNYLNLGCGFRFHPDWINVDFTITGQGVIAHNLSQEIPFSDASFDVVYHSHLLEHFNRNTANLFLKECYRVLRPQGIIRVAVPDLEQIARTYLISLEKAVAGSQEWSYNYEWILLEMYDQVVRNVSGGEMQTYLLQESIVNQDFIINRCGSEVIKLINMGQQNRQITEVKSVNIFQLFFKRVGRFNRYPKYLRELLLKLLLGQEYQLLEIGRFRQNGEIHQWMYDSYSLTQLLKKSGFEKIVKRTADQSYLPHWQTFNLDTEPDGTVYKPDSLFMEAIKP